MARRAAGDGSVFDRKDRPRGTKRWVAQIEIGTDPKTGRRRFKTTYHATKADAAAALSKMQEQARGGTLVAPEERLTLAELLERWVEVRRQRWRPGVEYEMKRLIDRHIAPGLWKDVPAPGKPRGERRPAIALGKERIDRLTGLKIQRFTASVIAGGYGGWTANRLHKIVKAALAQAVKWRLLGRNPADDSDAPAVPKRRRGRFWTIEETRRFLAATVDHTDYPLWLVMAMSGCRIGELLALHWDAVDEARGTITIAGGVVQVPGQGHVFGDPKTDAGRRTISLPPEAFAALRAQRARVAAAKLQLGQRYQDHGLVFPSLQLRAAPQYAGRAQSQRAANERFRLAQRAVPTADGGPPLTPIGFHGLRHFHATDLFRRGAHPKAVQARLGHATVGITMDLYTEHLPEVDKTLAEGLSDLVPRPGLSVDCQSPSEGTAKGRKTRSQEAS